MPSKADSPTKTCTLDDCGKPLRAKGLCSTHYNQKDPNRHVARAVTCAACGAEVNRPAKSGRRPACSVGCRTTLQRGTDGDGSGRYAWAHDAAKRARKAGATVVELFDRTDVFVRDDWTCQLCHLPVDVMASPFDPAAPTVDHVVPLSRGGEHTLANAQTACLRCNSIKSDHLQSYAE